jgi:hypothetical protein
MKREEVIEYLASLNPSEFEILTKEVSRIKTTTARKSWEQKHQAYLNKIQKNQERGESMKALVKPGMIVKCEGTKDHQGVREVLEINEFGIVARKLERTRRLDMNRWGRSNYITTHNWDKISEILNITIS